MIDEAKDQAVTTPLLPGTTPIGLNPHIADSRMDPPLIGGIPRVMAGRTGTRSYLGKVDTRWHDGVA